MTDPYYTPERQAERAAFAAARVAWMKAGLRGEVDLEQWPEPPDDWWQPTGDAA
jgi:hypothetical protein